MPNPNPQAEQADQPQRSAGRYIFWLAMIIVAFGAFAISVLAVLIILRDPTPDLASTMTVFNVLVPVFASWVGTILAFYFGRENFESASVQQRKTSEQVLSMAQMSAEELNSQPISAIMRTAADTVSFLLPADWETTVTLAQLLDKFTVTDTRIPVLEGTSIPKYMIFKSAIDSYLAADASRGKGDLLKAFIDVQGAMGLRYDAGSGFVLVAPTTTVAAAKTKLATMGRAKDIFVTATGKAGEALIGWVSDTRLLKELQG